MDLMQPPRSALAKTLFQSLLHSNNQDTAFYYNNREYSWQTVKEVIALLDQTLHQHQPGYHTRVAFVARTRPLHISCLWGLLLTDRCASMIHCYQSTSKIIQDLRQEGYRVILADQEDWNDELVSAAQSLNCLGIAITCDGIELLHQPQTPAGTAPGSYCEDDSVAAIETLSSGTTGSPKRIRLSRGNLGASTSAAVLSLTQMNAGASAPTPIISVLPLSNISGVYASTPALAMGLPMALLEKFQLDPWLLLVQRFQPIAADIPPAAMTALYQRQLPSELFRSIKVIRTGAAPLDRDVQAYFQNELKIPVNLSYGASEFCGVISSWSMAELAEFSNTKMGSCGRALAGVELRVTDPDSGAVLEENRVGRLEARVERVGPDWIATSDLVRIDADGFMWFAGRLEETIFRGGFKLSPLLIAEQLRQHPALADAAVLGQDDSRLGQVPVAVLEIKPGCAQPDSDQLTAFARQHLSAPEVPARFYFVETLPRTSSYKISLIELRRLLKTLGVDA
ncbi:long-chain fatty acid--CoA ligase [Pseudomaricurvus alcaniphilus]|uniref:class I adenylate-forming enzyme family protein n=1 Tax=Pseudomaricurvus alcaniphilus TaxID=1166482 RepID=UPI00140A8015|nr:fatty acid--CoA ligase family protein [Pseudomaricurvus alcaniphilus]NHN37286.1 long-chain fatty acid--CoA ligase [Pseudomaricurvus alcaniphilus]